MTTKQVQWNKAEEGVSTTLNLSCRPDGSIHIEDAQHQFTGEYKSVDEATKYLNTMFEQGIHTARSGS